MPTGSRSRLARVVHDLDAMLGDDTLAGVSPDERLEILATAGAALRRLEAMIVETVATGDAVDLPHGAGCRSTSELLQRTLSTDAAGAARIGKVVDLVRRDVNLLSGERLPARWPELRDAMLDGRVSVAGMLAATTPVERCRDRLTPDERASADQCLADAARGGYVSADAGERIDSDRDGGADAPIPTTDDLGILAHALVAVLDPDGAEPDDANAQHRRGLTIGRLRDGLRPIRGWLSPEVAAQLETVLDAINNPAGEGPAKPRVAFADADADPGTGADPFNTDPRNVIDGRTPLQKRHDAFAAALAIAARHKDMPTLGGAAPTLVVTMDVADLERGSGAASLPGRTDIRTHTCPHGSRRRQAAPARSNASCSTEGASSGPAARAAYSPCTSVERSWPGTRSASSRDATCRPGGARSITSPNTREAGRPRPTTGCRCAGGITARSTDRGGRSAWTPACHRCGGLPGGTPSSIGAHPGSATETRGRPAEQRLSGIDHARNAEAGRSPRATPSGRSPVQPRDASATTSASTSTSPLSTGRRASASDDVSPL